MNWSPSPTAPELTLWLWVLEYISREMVRGTAAGPRTLVCLLFSWPNARAGPPPTAELVNVGPYLNTLPYDLVSTVA